MFKGGIIESSPVITFADATVKALCVANWDTDDDGELTEAEAAAVTSLGEVFRDNYSITFFDELQYFIGLASIGEQAFYCCYGLTSVTIPNSVTRIGDEAFYNCCGLTSVTIPNSVTSIGRNPFSGCSGLTAIKVESGNMAYDSRNNCNAIIETATNTLIAGCENTVIPNSVMSIGDWAFGWCGLTSVTIPNSVTSIGGSAFYGCSGLTSVTIPNSVTSIGYMAFSGCTSLTSVTIPNSVTSIGWDAFNRCSRLTSVTIPNSVTSIGHSAFSCCSGLTSVTIGSNVTSIGDYAFEDCSGLTSVTAMMENPVSIGSSTFSNRANATLYVPYGCKAAYEDANYWKGFKEIVELPKPVDVTDVSQLADAIYIESAEARCGSQATLSVKMKNSVAIQTIQFDLYLPDGITVVSNEDNELVTASKERINKFNYFQSSMQSDGALRLLAQATSTNVPAGDGEICRIVVDIPESMQEGEYPLIFKGALMVEKNNTSHSPDPDLVQSKLTLLRYVPGDASGDGEVNAIDFNMIGNYILGDSQSGLNVKAADISGDGEVNAIDFNMVGNMILNGGGAAARMARTEEEKDPA